MTKKLCDKCGKDAVKEAHLVKIVDEEWTVFTTRLKVPGEIDFCKDCWQLFEHWLRIAN
jgi:hypothetical protein